MHIVKDRIRPAEDIIHVPFDVAVFDVYAANAIRHRFITQVAGIQIERILASQQTDFLQLHAIAIRPQSHPLVGTAINGIQQTVGYAKINQLEISALRPHHRRAVGAYCLTGTPGAKRILVPGGVAFTILMLAVHLLAIALRRKL